MVKTCTECRKSLPLSHFHKHAPSPDGHKPRCKDCRCAAERAARTNPTTRATQMWHDMSKRVKNQPEYAHVRVLMTQEEFTKWAVPKLAEWFANRPTERPSLDRKDAAKHYSLDNLQILELGENARQRRNAKNVHAPEGKAWCGCCKNYLDRSEFGQHRSMYNGLQKRCRRCRAR